MKVLTSQQKESVQNGEIEDKHTMSMRIRNSFADSISDIEFILKNRNKIEKKSRLSDSVDKESLRYVNMKLLDMLVNEFGDVDPETFSEILVDPVDSLEECWSVGNGYVHGLKQKVAIETFLAAFEDYNTNGNNPHPEEIEGFDEVKEIVNKFQE